MANAGGLDGWRLPLKAGPCWSRRQPPAASSALRPQARRPGARTAAARPVMPTDCPLRSSCQEVAVCDSVLLTVPLGASSDPEGPVCPHLLNPRTVPHHPGSTGSYLEDTAASRGLQGTTAVPTARCAGGQLAARCVREGGPAHPAPARAPRRSRSGALLPWVSCWGHEQRRRGPVPSHRPTTAAWAGQRPCHPDGALGWCSGPLRANHGHPATRGVCYGPRWGRCALWASQHEQGAARVRPYMSVHVA